MVTGNSTFVLGGFHSKGDSLNEMPSRIFSEK